MAGLNSKEEQELAELCDMPGYKVFKKMIDEERLSLATKTVVWNPNDSTGIAKLQGKAEALKELREHIIQIYHKVNKEK